MINKIFETIMMISLASVVLSVIIFMFWAVVSTVVGILKDKDEHNHRLYTLANMMMKTSLGLVINASVCFVVGMALGLALEILKIWGVI